MRWPEPVPIFHKLSHENVPGAVFCSFGAFEDRGFFALPGESPGPINL